MIMHIAIDVSALSLECIDNIEWQNGLSLSTLAVAVGVIDECFQDLYIDVPHLLVALC